VRAWRGMLVSELKLGAGVIRQLSEEDRGKIMMSEIGEDDGIENASLDMEG